jgi:hypothetical protein
MAYNYSNIDTPRNVGSGLADRFLFAPVEVFSKIQSPMPGSPAAAGDQVVIKASHLFVQDEGFINVHTAPFTNTLKAVTYGDPGSMAMQISFDAFLSGSYPEQHEYVKNAINTPCIVLVKDSNCESGFYYQVGTDCHPAYLTTTEFDTGDAKNGRKGYRVIFSYYSNAVYLYTGTPYLKGVDYGSALLWSAGNPLQYSVGNTLKYK